MKILLSLLAAMLLASSASACPQGMAFGVLVLPFDEIPKGTYRAYQSGESFKIDEEGLSCNVLNLSLKNCKIDQCLPKVRFEKSLGVGCTYADGHQFLISGRTGTSDGGKTWSRDYQSILLMAKSGPANIAIGCFWREEFSPGDASRFTAGK